MEVQKGKGQVIEKVAQQAQAKRDAQRSHEEDRVDGLVFIPFCAHQGPVPAKSVPGPAYDLHRKITSVDFLLLSSCLSTVYILQ